MGKLMVRLEQQLTTKHREDAEDCIEIYNKIKDMDKDNYVWSSKWTPFVDVIFGKYPSRRYMPNELGKIFLKGIRK